MGLFWPQPSIPMHLSPRRNPQPYRRSAARLAGHFQLGCNSIRPLAHARQPIVSRRRRLVCRKSQPVVAHFQPNLRGAVFQLHGQLPRPRVLLHIMDGLLRNAQNLALRARRQRPVRAEDAELRLQPPTMLRFHHAPQIHRQRRLARVL